MLMLLPLLIFFGILALMIWGISAAVVRKELDKRIAQTTMIAQQLMAAQGSASGTGAGQSSPTLSAVSNPLIPESKFTGGAFGNFGVGFCVWFVSMISLGLLNPLMVCWQERWIARHTYIEGHQLSFDGRAWQYFGQLLKILLLSVITLGLYYVFCGAVSMQKWRTKHTHFVDTANPVPSVFDGRWYQLLGVNLLSLLVIIITLSLGAYWAHCYQQRWLAKHQVIDGRRLCFDGKAIQYFGKTLLWCFLTMITLGIYGFWYPVSQMKWTVKHTKFAMETTTKK